MFELKICKNVQSIFIEFYQMKSLKKAESFIFQTGILKLSQLIDCTRFNLTSFQDVFQMSALFLGHQSHSISEVPDNIFTRVVVTIRKICFLERYFTSKPFFFKNLFHQGRRFAFLKVQFCNINIAIIFIINF